MTTKPDSKDENQPRKDSLKEALKSQKNFPFGHQRTQDSESRTKKEVARISHKEENLTVGEAEILLNDLEEKRLKIKKKLDELFQLRGVSPEYIRSYLSNPSNFSPGEWEALNKKRREVLDSLNLTPDLEKAADQFAPREYSSRSSSPNKDSSSSKERRKFSGARRGWLPMR